MNVIQEIAKWASTLPAWQSDAVRRIFTQDSLSAADETALLGMLLAANGLADPTTPAVAAIPFTAVATTASTTTDVVTLKELHSVENVNALVSGQSLKFGLSGITIVYGENGAGKSGYARVFKHACHARDKGDEILTDVSTKSKAKPAATVEFDIGGKAIAIRWRSGAVASEALSSVAVFDSHCARVFIDEANEVVYLPYGLDVFSRLVQVCSALKVRVNSELRTVPLQFDQAVEYSESTGVGRFVRALTYRSDKSQITSLSTMSEADEHRRSELLAIAASIKASTPKEQAARLRRIKARFQQLATQVTNVSTALSSEANTVLADLQSKAIAANEAAKLASALTLGNEPLQGAGTDLWRELFESARRFSEKIAYPTEQFPVTGENALCVLCQQPLAEIAGRRLSRFDDFVKDDTARRNDEASATLRVASKAVADLKLSAVEDDPSLLEEVKLFDSELGEAISAFFKSAKSLQDNIKDCLCARRPVPAEGIQNSPAERINDAVATLESNALEFEKADQPEERKKLLAELAGLEDRARLRSHADLVRKFIDQKAREDKLKKCEKALETSAITRRGTELMEQAVTERLASALKAELDYFGVECLPVHVKKIGDKGKTKHRLIVSETAKPSGILSEGEQRVIAICSFLAELDAADSRAPVVFDDPVSSLDHRYREKVSRRLVTEGGRRQVVVFTHDIVMLLALEREAGEQQIPLLIQTVSKSPSGPGQCMSNEPRPWYACSTKERLGLIRNTAAQFAKLSKGDPAAYAQQVGECYGRLRETWERMIEELLFQDVVQRFRPSVETQRLRRVSIEPADLIEIEHNMSRCSACLTGHDKAAAIGSPPLSPEEVAVDIKKLDDFADMLGKRADKTLKSTKQQLAAPVAATTTGRADTVTLI